MAIVALPLLQGTLDLLVLRCLSAGPRHGYAIATMVREQTGGDLSVEDAAYIRRSTACIARISSMPSGDLPKTTAARAFTR